MKIDLPQHPITWLFVGDSITHGWRHTDGARSYVEHVNETLRHAVEQEDLEARLRRVIREEMARYSASGSES